MTDERTTGKKLKITMFVMAILLMLSVALLLVMQCARQHENSHSSVTIPNNYVTSDRQSRTAGAARSTSPEGNGLWTAPLQAEMGTMLPLLLTEVQNGGDVSLRLHKYQADDSTPFRVVNMFPGDAETRICRVEVSYQNTVTVHFRADIRPGYEKLAEVLQCRVVLQNTGETLYDGLMRDIPGSLDHTLYSAEGTTEELVYVITSYLDTSVGNAYQNKTLLADFTWWVYGQGGSGSGDTSGEEEIPGGLIDPPHTGDQNSVLLWVFLLVISAGVPVLLVV